MKNNQVKESNVVYLFNKPDTHLNDDEVTSVCVHKTMFFLIILVSIAALFFFISTAYPQAIKLNQDTLTLFSEANDFILKMLFSFCCGGIGAVARIMISSRKFINKKIIFSISLSSMIFGIILQSDICLSIIYFISGREASFFHGNNIYSISLVLVVGFYLTHISIKRMS
ncbi:hypothetical protein [Photobacterium angustum]|uniref:Uncharacterized protein n=1 Tax=Photobacterium angustum TaxID=661 RepID=A0ABX5H1E7_PHOAN|nr:hypothetical protein [Photobacterium angustum]PSX07041.1 hypothetical protein C0W27_15850 [Photobacterium angustum]